MQEFRFPLAAPFGSKSFGNERADDANDPPVRPQFSLGRHDRIPLGARRSKDSGRGPTATPHCSIAQQRCRKRRLSGLSNLVVLAHRADLSLRHAMIFPPGFDVTSFFKAPEGWIDSAARETGHRDDIEAVPVALADGIQHGCGRIREGARVHMTYSTYVAPHVKTVYPQINRTQSVALATHSSADVSVPSASGSDPPRPACTAFRPA